MSKNRYGFKDFLVQLKNGVIDENPTLVQVLGMCPTLATTTSLINALGMGLATTAVLAFSNLFISLLRKFIPKQVRIAAYIVIISGFVTAVEMLMKPSWFLTSVLPYLLIFAVMFFMFHMMVGQGGGGNNAKMMNFGKSRATMTMNNDGKGTTFKEVAGVAEEKEELQEIVDFLRNPKKYIQLGAKIPKGVILVGPPGTGKTLLAKAVAGEAGVPFFSISGSDFVEMFVGVGASRVRDLFADAKKNAP